MAQVLIARGMQWVKPLHKTLTPASQATLALYMVKAQAKGHKVELWGYMASGALAIKEAGQPNKPLDKATRLGYKGDTLGQYMGQAYVLNSKGNPTPKATKVRARVCHN